MKKSNLLKTIAFILLAVAIASFVFFDIFDFFGISKVAVEDDARKSQYIDNSWKVSKSSSEDMVAMLFYPEDMGDYTYSMYVNRDNSRGYFFRAGGSGNYSIVKGVAVVGFEDINSVAYISMNNPKITKMKLEDKEIDINPSKPFVFVLPSSENPIFYNKDGEFNYEKLHSYK